MSDITCKRCRASDYVKNGNVRGLQRYRCRQCGCNFTATPPRGKPAAMKALTLLLYSMGNMSYRMIGRLLGTSHVSIHDWIRAEAEQLPEPEIPADLDLVMLDEMWHFIQSKKTKNGSSKPWIVCQGEPWPGFSVVVMLQRVQALTARSTTLP